MAVGVLFPDEKLVVEILVYEQQNGTWKTIKKYNAVSGDGAGRNTWVKLRDGHTADLCWMFDVAIAAGAV